MEGISTIVRKLTGSKKVLSLGMALFLVAGALAGNAWLHRDQNAGKMGILGGPTDFSPVAEAAGEPILEANAQISTVLDLGYANLNTLSEASFESQDQISLGNKDFASVAVLQAALDEELDSHEPSPKPTLRLTNYFIQPARGTNWGILHAHNAVDIANVCGTSVVASAAGIVTESSGEGNWNGGYGNYVVLEHPNGVKTKYAHLGTVGVSLGDEVRQGDGIGTIGATGHVVGATGCHLHFEVLGAVNPFVRR